MIDENYLPLLGDTVYFYNYKFYYPEEDGKKKFVIYLTNYDGFYLGDEKGLVLNGLALVHDSIFVFGSDLCVNNRALLIEKIKKYI